MAAPNTRAMSNSKPSALLFLLASIAFVIAAGLSLTRDGSHVAAIGFGGVAILFLINAFVVWKAKRLGRGAPR